MSSILRTQEQLNAKIEAQQQASLHSLIKVADLATEFRNFEKSLVLGAACLFLCVCGLLMRSVHEVQHQIAVVNAQLSRAVMKTFRLLDILDDTEDIDVDASFPTADSPRYDRSGDRARLLPSSPATRWRGQREGFEFPFIVSNPFLVTFVSFPFLFFPALLINRSRFLTCVAKDGFYRNESSSLYSLWPSPSLPHQRNTKKRRRVAAAHPPLI